MKRSAMAPYGHSCAHDPAAFTEIPIELESISWPELDHGVVETGSLARHNLLVSLPHDHTTSGTIIMAPHGHSCAHNPQPLQKS
jgi:hypothetical protein